jgi:hypothetical protein
MRNSLRKRKISIESNRISRSSIEANDILQRNSILRRSQSVKSKESNKNVNLEDYSILFVLKGFCCFKRLREDDKLKVTLFYYVLNIYNEKIGIHKILLKLDYFENHFIKDNKSFLDNHRIVVENDFYRTPSNVSQLRQSEISFRVESEIEKSGPRILTTQVITTKQQ